VVHRFIAVTTLLSVVSFGAVVLAPWSNAATQTGPSAFTPVTGPSASTQAGETTTVPGKNPHSRLCHRTPAEKRTISKEEADARNLSTANWSGYQRFLLAYDDGLSQTAQAVLDRGNNVPAGVRSAARSLVKNINAMQALVRKAKSTAELNASMQATLTNPFASFGPVFDYVGAQCGSYGSSSGTVAGTAGQMVTGTSASPN
jgi:hypothetical protein